MRGLAVLALAVVACGDNAEPPLPEVVHAAEWVDPRIGTGGLGYAHGSCFVGPAAPHGLAKPGPDTNGLFGTVNFQHFSGYFAEDDRIRGFSQLHLHGTGATDYGILSLMPTLAFDPTKTRVVDYEARFAKQDERVQAAYYAVKLASGIDVELTASPRVAVHRYTLPDAGAVVIDLAKTLEGGTVDTASITLDAPAREFTGELHHTGGMSGGFGGYTLYFAARVSQPWTQDWTWDTGAALALPAGETTIAIGLSFVSVAGARKNLDTEVPVLDFDAVRAQTYERWNEQLGVVKLTGGTEAQRRTFYTSLYHAFLMPTVIEDVDGAFRLANGYVADAHDASWRMVSDMSLWDTYRTVAPLYSWLAPQSARDQAHSLHVFAQQLGKYPKWPIAIGESGVMLGASAEIVIADAYARGGIQVVDSSVFTSATSGGREHEELYLQYGFVPRTVGRSASHTIEYGHDDYARAQLPGAMGPPPKVSATSKSWRNLYDPAVGFLRGRNPDGTFPTDAFDPLVWTDDYAEANAWQSLFAPGIHDPEGIAEVLGGSEAAIEKLTTFFEKAKEEWDTGDESAANFPRRYYWHGNEPDINAPYLFLQLGRPELTYKWARWVIETMYSDQPDGVAGNDDGGTLGAWYVLSALGLYPIAGGDRWLVAAPLFPKARIVLGERELVIEAEGSGPYVESVELDGVRLDVLELGHAELATASSLRFVLSSQP